VLWVVPIDLAKQVIYHSIEFQKDPLHLRQKGEDWKLWSDEKMSKERICSAHFFIR